MYTRIIAKRDKRKFDLIITLAFLLSLICSLPAATVSAQAGEPNEPPTTPVEESLPDLNSLTNHLFLPFVNSNAIDPVPADVRESAAEDELVSLATNVVACNERSGWQYIGAYRWSSLVWNNVSSGCSNIYVNPSASSYIQVVYYSNSQGRWIWKPYQWVPSGSWTQMGTGFSAGTNWYARAYNFATPRWVNIKTTSGRVANSNPPSTGNPGDLLTHSQAKSLLSSGGITTIVSSGNCSDKNVSTCTSLDGVRRGSVQGLIDFKRKCDAVKGTCDVWVTGGTETGHSNGTYSHSTGYKIDFKWSFGNGDNYAGRFIKENFTRVYNRGSWGEAYVDSATGYLYVFESSPAHWDVCFSASC